MSTIVQPVISAALVTGGSRLLRKSPKGIAQEKNFISRKELMLGGIQGIASYLVTNFGSTVRQYMPSGLGIVEALVEPALVAAASTVAKRFIIDSEMNMKGLLYHFILSFAAEYAAVMSAGRVSYMVMGAQVMPVSQAASANHTPASSGPRAVSSVGNATGQRR